LLCRLGVVRLPIGNTGGPKIWVIPKAQLRAGANPISWTEFFKTPGYADYYGWVGWTMQRAHVYGTSSAEYFFHACFWWDDFSYVATTPGCILWLIRI
jgi:hypothetical protein